MDRFVTEQDVNYYEVIKRGGSNGGDEDFDFIRCPNCQYIYLVDSEVDTLYLNASDLARRATFFESHDVVQCVACDFVLQSMQIWAALRREIETVQWRVSWNEIQSSAWVWAINPDGL